MCTSIFYKTKNSYFGRTLDYEFSYGEKITITPRNYSFKFRYLKENNNHYAIIGMAHIENNYPLYYEAMNEKGLAIAGLNFVNNAKYNEVINSKNNVCQFELIPYILINCTNIKEVKELLKNINITSTPFSNKLPCSSLHWMVSDLNNSIVIESTKDGLNIYDNEIGVLTNNPPFINQLENLNKYQYLSNENKNDSYNEAYFSRGLGAVGLPGDLSSMSRFVRVYFTKKYSLSSEEETKSVGQFFHIMNSVNQQRGCCKLNDKYEITIYTSCLNLNEGIYYYNTYNNKQISAINLFKENLNNNNLITYELIDTEQIKYQN